MKMQTKDYNASFKDIDINKSELAGYFANFHDVDSYNEITNKGAFTKTIAENGPNGTDMIRWAYNHDMHNLLGSFLVLKEDDYGLFYRGKLGDMIYARELRKMIDCGINIKHSYGYKTIKDLPNADGVNVLLEVKLFEGSCLSVWPANFNTPLVPVFSTEGKSISDQVDSFISEITPYIKYKSISEAKDDEIKELEGWIDMQKKSFYEGIEANVKQVKAPEEKKDDHSDISIALMLLKSKKI